MSAGARLAGGARKQPVGGRAADGRVRRAARAAIFPYAAIDASLETDWSHKSGSGREVMVAVTLWDDQPARLQMLADAVEADGARDAIGPETGSW